MGITSLQVCMDSSDWLQGTISEDGAGMDSSPITTPTGGSDDILTCSRPLIERRLRPQHEQSQKCPRCESTHTKFCYYNNYSLSQPRFFCKTCRRYWTKGGTLRNIPVGGGCRKNKKISTNKKPTSSSSSADNHHLQHNNNNNQSSSSSSLILNTINHNHNHHHGLTYNNHNQENDHNNNHTDLHLAFPEQIHFSSLHGLNPHGNLFLDANNNNNPTPIDFMAHDSLIMGNGENAFGGIGQNGNFHGICAPFGGGLMSSVEHHGINLSAVGANHILESYNHHHNHHLDQINHHHEADVHDHDVKPNKILSLEWHDHQQACNSDIVAGYNFGGLGSWTGLMNGYGSSATNPLV